MTAPAAPRPGAGPRGPEPSSRVGDQGLIALEWLLIVAAVAGLAAVSVRTVQQVVDDAAEAPIEPGVRFIDAEIAAAAIASEATAWRAGLSGSIDWNFYQGPSDAGYVPFRERCEGLEESFADIVASASFHPPEDDPDVHVEEIVAPARCEVTARAGLGG